jgi:hypothetical protein
MNTDDRPLEQDDYQGVYLLVESIKNSKNRLDLKQLTVQDTTPDTLSGGYILKFELDVAEQPTVPCQSANRNVPCWIDLELHDPKSPNPEQLAWITSHVQAFHNTLFGSNYADAMAHLEPTQHHLFFDEYGRQLDRAGREPQNLAPTTRRLARSSVVADRCHASRGKSSVRSD